MRMLSRFAFGGSTASMIVVLFVASNTAAHHSFSPHFDSSRKVHIAGTVKAYEARNPHSYLHINAVDENGRTRELLTPAGEKAVASYDPFKDDPVFRCDPVAVQRVWQAPSTPLEIVRDGGDIVLHHEWMDVRRVIHMNTKTHPKGNARSSLGHSIGHWEGNTLVIETGNYSAGVLEQYVEQRGQPTKGLLHSASLTTVERLHVDTARQRLIVDVDITDPEFFKQPLARETMEYSPSDLKILPFKCSREGLTGTIRNAAKP
jgi:hypothetical protein